MPRSTRGHQKSAFLFQGPHNLHDVLKVWELSPGPLVTSMVKAILMYTSYRKTYVNAIGLVPARPENSYIWNDTFKENVLAFLNLCGATFFPHTLPTYWREDFVGTNRPVWKMASDKERITIGMLLVFEFLKDNDANEFDLNSALPLSCFIGPNCDICGGNQSQGGDLFCCAKCDVSYHLACCKSTTFTSVNATLVCKTCGAFNVLEDVKPRKTKSNGKRPRESDWDDDYKPDARLDDSDGNSRPHIEPSLQIQSTVRIGDSMNVPAGDNILPKGPPRDGNQSSTFSQEPDVPTNSHNIHALPTAPVKHLQPQFSAQPVQDVVQHATDKYRKISYPSTSKTHSSGVLSPPSTDHMQSRDAKIIPTKKKEFSSGFGFQNKMTKKKSTAQSNSTIASGQHRASSSSVTSLQPKESIAVKTPSHPRKIDLSQEQIKGTVLLLSRSSSSTTYRAVRLHTIHSPDSLFEACKLRLSTESGGDTPSKLLLKLPDRIKVKGWMELERGNWEDFEELLNIIKIEWDNESRSLHLPILALYE